ncbi:MFS transporter [Craterilacuibacter sp. RT1T]|uniref:MFS transporter n=1 Tax=Craterilacuibacter sp. RT1T TaxID=2942211 RepID=UPI0020BDA27B|nr:MFS transporter [Craterilacuibacter sp. RT1T]MCL6261810.1 MFS transporter [Craterilacuibacter sp. RT1T]
MTIRIQRWEPENLIFWLARGKPIARRNLLLSILALHLNFNIWMMWSMVVVNLPSVGFSITHQQQFLLVSIPPLTGAVMRVIYSSLWSWTGGGTWLALSTLLLLIPAFGVGHVVQDISTPFPLLLLISACCGIGGGASSSHLSNTNLFFPKAQKGLAMGLNAGIGNLGVSMAQLLIPLAISVPLFGALAGSSQIWGHGGEVYPVWLQNAGYLWIAPILLVSALCFVYAHDLPKLRLTPRDQWQMMQERHTWYVCFLYMGTYGTFLGMAAAFPLLSRTLFPLHDATPYLFIGPMLAALSRPFGGWCGDRIGGGISVIACYAVLIIGTLGVIASLPDAESPGSFWLFLAMCQLLFLAAGIGNGAAYQLAPKVFMLQAGREAHARGETVAQTYQRGTRRGTAAMGVSSVMAAFGGFVIPETFGYSLETAGSFMPAFVLFLLFYLLCATIAWRCYTRASATLKC